MKKRLAEEPFMARSVPPQPTLFPFQNKLTSSSENIMMALTQKGESRQIAHEKVKKLSHQAAKAVKEEGKDNDLIDRIRADKFFEPILDQLDDLLDPIAHVGRSAQQVEKFTGPGGEVESALGKYQAVLQGREQVDLKV